MQRKRAIAIHLGVTLAILALDLWTKAAVFRLLGAEVIARPEQGPILVPGEPVIIFPGFALEAAINLGAFNGMLASWRGFLLGISVVAAVGTFLIAAVPRRMPIGIVAALGMIAGGALGNFYDRLQFGAVRDFVKWYIGDNVWPNFNIADSGIVVGVGMILLFEFRKSRREKQQLRDAAADDGPGPAAEEPTA